LVLLLRENLLLCSSRLPLGVPNSATQILARLSGAIAHIKTFSGAVAGEKDHFCKGSLSLSIFLLCYFFCFLIFVCCILSKIQKKISILFIVVIFTAYFILVIMTSGEMIFTFKEG